jgi:hypothetical protein
MAKRKWTNDKQWCTANILQEIKDWETRNILSIHDT